MLSRQIVRKTAALGNRGAIAAARIQSADAARAMLEQGGNAVDAAVSAALVAGVIEPMETTLGGSGFMVIAGFDDGRAQSVDFGPRAPRAVRAEMFPIDTSRIAGGSPGISISPVLGDTNVQGITSIGVPATIRGLAAALERFGKLPLVRVMAPAIEAAYDGFECDSYYSLETLANLQALRADPGARSLYLVDGLPPVAAHLGAVSLGTPAKLRQKDLGRTLEVIAERGPDAFYEGEVGRSLLETVRELGGVLDEGDLRACQPHIAQARRVAFRNVEVWAPNAPCGGVTELQILQIWQALYPDGSPLRDTPERFRHLAEAIWHAFADRYHWLGDPQFVPVPEQALLSVSYANQIAADIRSGKPFPQTPPGSPGPWSHFASHAAHDPWPHQPDGGGARPRWRPGGGSEPTAGTTHVAVIDGDGLAVSLTHTAGNHFGSKVVCPRTGILFDNVLGWFNAMPGAANSIAGGKRPLANMGPIVITRDGFPRAAIGAPGGRRIISAVAQVAINLVDRGMNAEEAIHSPRCDASGPDLLVSERLASVCDELVDLRRMIRLVSEQHEGHGYELARPIVVVRDTEGSLQAAADPFSRGYAVGI